MKTASFIFLLFLLTFPGYGQSAPTKIYLVKNGVQTLGGIRFYTNFNPDKPIIVKNKGYVLIETDADSLGIIRDSPYTDNDYQQTTSSQKRKPLFIKFDRGKSYYFKMGSAVYSTHFDIEEMTERAFLLYVGLNNLGTNLTRYILSNEGGLVKSQQ